jgi:bacterioferritin (cytochrome b1)
MTAFPGVLDALNALIPSEVTLHEAAHGWEYVFAFHKVKRLRKFFRWQLRASHRRRAYLEKRIIRLGGTIRISMTPATIDPAGDVGEVVADSTRFFVSLLDGYRAAWNAIHTAGDITTASEVAEMERCIERAIFELEAFAVQIENVGLAPWIQSQL